MHTNNCLRRSYLDQSCNRSNQMILSALVAYMEREGRALLFLITEASLVSIGSLMGLLKASLDVTTVPSTELVLPHVDSIAWFTVPCSMFTYGLVRLLTVFVFDAYTSEYWKQFANNVSRSNRHSSLLISLFYIS